MQGFPINAAKFSKCHFPKVWGTSHCFPLWFTVGGNTTQEPGQSFEIKLEDALSCAQKHRERRFDSDHVSHSWSPALPLLLMEGNYSSHGTGPAAQAGGWGTKAKPTPSLLTLYLEFIPPPFNWTQAAADQTFWFFFEILIITFKLLQESTAVQLSLHLCSSKKRLRWETSPSIHSHFQRTWKCTFPHLWSVWLMVRSSYWLPSWAEAWGNQDRKIKTNFHVSLFSLFVAYSSKQKSAQGVSVQAAAACNDPPQFPLVL